MCKTEWIRCPICGSKTRDKIREDTSGYRTEKLPALLSEV